MNALGPEPASAELLFAGRLPLARRYAASLVTVGLERGLLGPREADRIWDRHILNSAVLTDLLPSGARFVDVGSGAGLPGIPMVLRRSDLKATLIEPMQRRTNYLTEVVDDLGLTQSVRVVRGRASELATVRKVGAAADWVVARAVAPLGRLVKWCLPLLGRGGTLLAQKGGRAREEARDAEQTVRRCGMEIVDVTKVGDGVLGEPTWVISVRRV